MQYTTGIPLKREATVIAPPKAKEPSQVKSGKSKILNVK
jgi:hypothetical protein